MPSKTAEVEAPSANRQVSMRLASSVLETRASTIWFGLSDGELDGALLGDETLHQERVAMTVAEGLEAGAA